MTAPHRRGAPGCALALALAVVLGAVPTAATATVPVRVEGRVAHAGVLHLPDGARLSQALLAADVLPEAYVPGASWLRPGLALEQTRLKAGILFSLGVVAGRARSEGDAAMAATATALSAAVRAMPVTGRRVDALLDPRPLEVSRRDHRLAAGDRVIYPPRPSTVRVTGAVARDCELPHVPLRDARRYRGACALTVAADPDWLYVIQPDGHTTREGIALWNREPGQALAPGAIVYVPLRAGAVIAVGDPALNDDIARFLATQYLPAVAP